METTTRALLLVAGIAVLLLARRASAMSDDTQTPQGLERVQLVGPMPEGDRQAFADWLGPAAREAQRVSGIPASVTVGVAMYETAAGGSHLARFARNLFGMTAAGTGWNNPHWHGEKTWRSDRYWRVYDSRRDSLLDFVSLFYRSGAYAAALAYRGDPDSFLALIVPKYAPSSDGNPGYTQAVRSLIEAYDLRRFDLPPAEWALDPRIVPRVHIATWEDAVGGTPA